ncbi:hypothetical protein B1810_10755 [Panacagrimonas perspica]|uniref:TonB-dependent receptor plug domain-containing protein n=1 Tax=Panacagrimonas perspica TaxID=381431 RepID=UPI001136D5EE|nr:TonB-dependent receptor plug domain-containing protein [Panacagrimonas perspica]THD03067.1 hypothetical protein B1810_10755 [Panacagrimonas perspica]
MAVVTSVSYPESAKSQAPVEPVAEQNAQTDDADADVANIIVEGNLDARTSRIPTAPTPSIYGIDASILDTPRSISQINEEQLTTDLIRSADDLVKYAPGLTRGGGQNVSLTPQIRGQNSELFQNGQRIYSERRPTNLNAYEGADIVAGPSSVVFGPVGGAGGYINYVTKKPDFRDSHSEFTSQIGTWVPGGGSHDTSRLTFDTTGPINDKLAYRLSVTRQKADDYYDNVKNNFDAFFAAVSWVPKSNVRVEWNGSYDDYYNFNVTHGWNRQTQDLVDSYGQDYSAGRATPILRGPDGNGGTVTWSPVFQSGDPTSPVTGWQVRTPVRNTDGRYAYTQYTAGPIQPLATRPGATAATAGTLLGFVYDPSLQGNGLASIDPNESGRAADKNAARRLSTQLNVAWDVSPTFSLVNSTLLQDNHDYLNSVGTFLGSWDTSIFEHRLEARLRREFTLFGQPVQHGSNTGGSWRREDENRLSSNVNFLINMFDLTQDPDNKYPGYIYGLFNQRGTAPGQNPNANAAGGSGAWRGTPGVPQNSPYFGYVNLPPAYPVRENLYAELLPGRSYAYETETTSLFTQHNFTLGEQFGLNVGGSRSFVSAKAENPLHPDGVANTERSDSGRFRLTAFQVSPYWKPVSNVTLYFTSDNTLTFSTGNSTTPAVPTGAAAGTAGGVWKLNANNFKNDTEMQEVGIKYDVIPNQLFATLAGYKQQRDIASQNAAGETLINRFKFEGYEASLRYQPTRQIAAGLNLSKVEAKINGVTSFSFSPVGFVPDNATVFGDSNVLNQRPAGDFKAAGLPEYSTSAFVSYRHDSGFGGELSGWWTSDWYTHLDHRVKVPSSFNVDLNLSYRQPAWEVGVLLSNLTDEENFVNALAGATAPEFLQPMRPFSVLGQVTLRF